MLLYKYLDRGGIAAVKDRQIKLTPPPDFNDPYDGLVQITRLARKDTLDRHLDDRVAKKIKESSPEAREALRAFLGLIARPFLTADFSGSAKFSHDMRLALGERYGVVSLSEEPRNPLMWSYYADKHSGFVLGFDSTSPPFTAPPENTQLLGRCHRVNYVLYKPPWPGTAFTQDSEVEFLRLMLLVKSLQWQHEREWRLIDRMDRSTKSLSDDTIHTLELPPNAVSEVWFGSQASTDLRRSVLEALELWGVQPKLFNAAVCHDSYAIEGRPVSESEAAEAWLPAEAAPKFEDVEDVARQFGEKVGRFLAHTLKETIEDASKEAKKQSPADDS